MKTQTSAHHLLFERRLWEARKETKLLRQMGGNIVRLSLDSHTALHRAVSSVPVPNIYMARRMYSSFEPQGDIFRNIDALCSATEESIQHHRTTELDKQLGGLIICSLQEQKPFIREGLYVHK